MKTLLFVLLTLSGCIKPSFVAYQSTTNEGACRCAGDKSKMPTEVRVVVPLAPDAQRVAPNPADPSPR